MKLKGKEAPKPDPVIVRRENDRAVEYALRTPFGPSELDKFTAELEDHERPFARMLWRMECTHDKLHIVAKDSGGMWSLCDRCGWMSRKPTRRAEWSSYLPSDYDAFDWEELFTKDKSMWRYIFNEVQEEMLAPYTEGDSDGSENA